MSVNRVLRILDGNVVDRLRDFLTIWWSRIEFEAMLVPILQPGGREVAAQEIKDPASLVDFSPFAPLMLNNTASVVGEFVRNNSNGPLAVLLRPCELRALIELQKLHRISLPALERNGTNHWVVLIGIDCPGTLVSSEFARQVDILGMDTLTREMITDSEKGGFLNEYLRKACQLCEWPVPCGTDLTIGIFGTLSRQSILLIPKDEAFDAQMRLGEVSDGLVTEVEISLRGNVIQSMMDRRAANRENPGITKFANPADISNLLASFTRCTLCADCLDACPLYEGELSGLLGVGGLHQVERPLLADFIRIGRWLASCSGCGMCEEVCEWDIPLTLLISKLSRPIRNELGYTAGEPGLRLPWVTA
jgi:formate dehydrogenase (coenzyme F420) beta subunit